MTYAAGDGGGGEIGVGGGGVEMVAIDEGVWCGETETGEDEPGRAVPDADGDGVGGAEGPQPTKTPATTILAMNPIIAYLRALTEDALSFAP